MIAHFALILATAIGGLASPQDDPTHGDADAREMVRHLRENYAGFPVAQERLGALLEEKIERCLLEASQAEGETLDEILRELLFCFGDGHLLMHSSFSPAMKNPGKPLFYERREPFAEALDERTFLIRVPSFHLSYEPAVKAIVAKHEQEIRSRDRLIIDVRGNTGGSDLTYEPLLPMLATGPIAYTPLEWRCTEENAAGIAQQIAGIPSDNEGLCQMMNRLVEDMRANVGELKQLALLTEPLTFVEWEQPSSVAILIDHHCSSSGEQFLLSALQSDKVVICGETSYGAVDFLNPRQVPLPSGERTLLMAMSVRQTAWTDPVDATGIVPHHPLDKALVRDADDAIRELVRYWPEKAATSQ